MRLLATVMIPGLLSLSVAGCERFEAPAYAERQVLPVDVQVAAVPGAGPVRLVRDRRPRDTGPQTTQFQGGRLHLRDGCLMLEGALVLWPRDARLDLSEPGRIAIADVNGRAIAGEYMSVTGEPWPGRLESPDLGPCAGLPVQRVNDFEPMSPAQWRAFHDPGRFTRPPPPPDGARPQP